MHTAVHSVSFRQIVIFESCSFQFVFIMDSTSSKINGLSYSLCSRITSSSSYSDLTSSTSIPSTSIRTSSHTAYSCIYIYAVCFLEISAGLAGTGLKKFSRDAGRDGSENIWAERDGTGDSLWTTPGGPCRDSFWSSRQSLVPCGVVIFSKFPFA
jgi:hypothetical protein